MWRWNPDLKELINTSPRAPGLVARSLLAAGVCGALGSIASTLLIYWGRRLGSVTVCPSGKIILPWVAAGAFVVCGILGFVLALLRPQISRRDKRRGAQDPS